VVLGVQLAGLARMVLGVKVMAVRDMRMVRRLLAVVVAVMLGRVAVVLGGELVVMGGLGVVLGKLLAMFHGGSLLVWDR